MWRPRASRAAARARPRSRRRRARRAPATSSRRPRRGSSPSTSTKYGAPGHLVVASTRPRTSRPGTPAGASLRIADGLSRVGAVRRRSRCWTPAAVAAPPSVSQNPWQVVQPVVRNASSVGARARRPPKSSASASPTGLVPASAARASPRARRAASAGAGTAAPASLVRRAQPPQDLRVAAQQPGHEHEQQHEQHGLDRHDRGHQAALRLPGAASRAPPGSPPRGCRCCRRPSACRCSSSSASVAGFWQITAGTRPRSIPWTCVLHWP